MRLAEELIRAEIDIMQRTSGLPIDSTALAVASNIWRTSQLFRQKMEQEILRSYDLSWSAFSSLFIIWVWGPIEMSAIAASQHVSRPTVTGIVDLLEKRGYCRRQPMGAPGDRRTVEVILTAAGRTLIEEVFPQFNQGERAFTACLTPDEADTLAHLLRKLILHNGETDKSATNGKNGEIFDTR